MNRNEVANKALMALGPVIQRHEDDLELKRAFLVLEEYYKGPRQSVIELLAEMREK